MRRGAGSTILTAVEKLFSINLPQPCWTPVERAIVETAVQKIPEGAAREDLQKRLKSDQATPWLVFLAESGIIATGSAIVLWGLLFLAYPRSRRVQALFLFRPKARAILSAGLFPLALTVVPGLRRWLLNPFRSRLLAGAHLEQMQPGEWFERSQLRDRRSQTCIEASELTASLDRLIVIEGEPGLGKTMLLRQIAAAYKRPLAYLNARDCDSGVINALSAMLLDLGTGEGGETDRDKPIRDLIYTRDLALVIDGLNEVSVTTRARILEFCREMSGGLIVIATQPLDWSPPDAARWLELLPLNRARIEDFLVHRATTMTSEDAAETLRAGASEWLNTQLDQAASPEERELAQVLLSNPFDLTFAADLLAQGLHPKPGALIEAAFGLACDRYVQRHRRPFPVAAFCQIAYDRRLTDRADVTVEEARDEVGPLTDLRLLRRWVDERDGKSHVEWRFRHDRVMNFFIYVHFERRGQSANEEDRRREMQRLLADHEEDPRFRGVFLLIAQKAPESVATWVRELILQRAVARQEHSLLDAFVYLHNHRLRASRIDTADVAANVEFGEAEFVSPDSYA